jgi:hypothetical protein
MFKIGESDGGRKLKVTMKEYIEYALYNRDDSPLYLFEANLEEHLEFKAVLDDYKPPEILKMDLFTELVSQLNKNNYDLYRRAIDMNSRDNFVMWDHREKYK